MKKLTTLILSLVVSGSAFSQSNLGSTFQIRKDTIITESADKYKVETNRFFDNWFLGAGAGAQVYFSQHDKNLSFGDRIKPTYNAFIGKWFTPGVGVRIGGSLSEGKSLSVNNNSWYTNYYSTGETTTIDGKTYFNQQIKYAHVNGNVLFNLSNILGGYKENRVFNISPYAGIGYLWSRNKSETHENELTGTAGLFNTFRLGKALLLSLDVNGVMANGRFSHKYDPDKNISGRRDYIGSASLGLVYKFNERSWSRSKSELIQYNESDLALLRGKVNELAADNDALRKQLAEAKNTTITDVKIEKSVLISPILVTFQINKSIVSNEARVNLGFFAKAIKEVDNNVVYKVTGYADKGTGSVQTNERLSRERANAIYNVLVREFGVNPNKLEVSYEGGVDNMYYNDPRLSRAVITIAK